ncbi:MAG: MmgE/PrpD family protein [Chloroflexi bacterium]|nr:MmgE/PrpD family protein [Chloroflexota bacterium]
MGTTETFARFIVETTFEELPRQLVSYSKELFLDAIGCALAGSVCPTGRKIIRFTRESGGVAECAVIGAGFRTSAPSAALANGTLCHSMDYDDMNYNGHPSAPIAPVLLALGEKLRRSGREIMEAHAVAFEVYGKIAGASKELYDEGWHPTAIFGAMGATAAAAKLLKLDVEQTMNAFGIAASQTGGVRSASGTMTKPLHAGHAARAGVVAAMLAGDGFTGRSDTIENARGFSHAFIGPGKYDLRKMTEDLGKPFRMEYAPPSIKKYPCCGNNQRAIDAIFRLIEMHGISYADVESVVVDVDGRVGDSLIFAEPKTGNEGRFSLQYNMAAALLDGKIDLGTYTDEKAASPAMKEAERKVRVKIHQDWDTSSKGRRHPVAVHLKNGQVLRHVVDKLRGSPDLPLSRQELMDKYTDCASRVLSGPDIARSAKLILKLDQLEDISELMAVIIGG